MVKFAAQADQFAMLNNKGSDKGDGSRLTGLAGESTKAFAGTQVMRLAGEG